MSTLSVLESSIIANLISHGTAQTLVLVIKSFRAKAILCFETFAPVSLNNACFLDSRRFFHY